MSQIDESFETIQRSLRTILPEQDPYEIRRSDHALLLEMPADVAAFSVFNGHVKEEFDTAYREFKALYRKHHSDWDNRTLSFVLCRVSEKPEDDRFYAEREHDPLFCRKYVIHAHEDVGRQSEELLRLPFLPFPDDETFHLQRPRSAQDLLQTAGIAASLSRKLVEPRQRAPEGIVEDLLGGKETLPDFVIAPNATNVASAKPRNVSRLTEATVESFRAYGGSQTFSLDASVVVLYGPNGLGKTSFFDAIDYGCTGRIGRLCRQRKLNQEDFSRVATYLDDTAGTGSVVLRGTSGQHGQDLSDWLLRRGTGNWSTAWINDAKHDRLSTLTRLTNADWGEVKPRQQNVESLFRATHLFGQDEQELLSDFRKSSMLPESFVSEMLALQDYSQGLTKTRAVTQLLTKQKATLEAEIKSIEAETSSLLASIAQVDESHTQDAIDRLTATIREHARAGKLAFPDDQVTLSELSDWIELASAQSDSAQRRIQDAKAARTDLPLLEQAQDRIASCKTQLASLDAKTKSLSQEKEDLQKNDATIRANLTSAKTSRIELGRRKRELEAAHKWSSLRSQHEERLKQARADHTNKLSELEAVKTRLASLQPELSASVSDSDSHSQSMTSLESQLQIYKQVEAGFSEHCEAHQKRADTSEELDELVKQHTSLGDQIARLREDAETAKAELEQLEPAHERAKLQQAELDNLLDAIQSHLTGCDCPLCGTDFSTNDALLAQINQHRNKGASEPSVSITFAQLKAAEARAQDALSKAIVEAASLSRKSNDLRSRIEALDKNDADFLSLVTTLVGQELAAVEQPLLDKCKADLEAKYVAMTEQRTRTQERIADLREQQQAAAKQQSELQLRADHFAATCKTLNEELLREDARYREVLEAEQITDSDVESKIATVETEVQKAHQAEEELRLAAEQHGTSLQEAEARMEDAQKRRLGLNDELQQAQKTEANMKARLSDLQLADDTGQIDEAISTLETGTAEIRKAISDARTLETALKGIESQRRNDHIKKQVDALNSKASALSSKLTTAESHLACLKSVDSLLDRERQAAVGNHISAYGPLISNIQQRLRSVYGFGGVHLDARGGEVAVKVEWRNKDVHLRPTDFFSDSQKQILMLSVFLAGGLRQNWSGFAPVLLDDPVTHFDDLNAYAFVELIRGIISPQPNEWQFIISTCEERLFSLMQKKFSRLNGGAIFYEFLGMSDKGPIVERCS